MIVRSLASAVVLFGAVAVAAPSCYVPSWSSENGNLYLGGQRFHMKGVNWYGFDAEINVVQGLWGTNTLADQLDNIAATGFNAIRLPISLTMALDKATEVTVTALNDPCHTDCSTGKSWDVLTKLISGAADRGLLVMLDMHTFVPGVQVPVWYTEDFTEEDYHTGWMNLLKEYKSWPNVFAIDLLNEPRGAGLAGASWGIGDAETDWGQAAARLINAIVTEHPEYTGLFFVEGVEARTSATPYTAFESGGDFPHWWGGNLEGLYENPLNLGTDLNKRIVYAPHVYGPATATQPYFREATFPTNMPDVWDRQLGFQEALTGRATVLGEWGGFYGTEDVDGPDGNINGVPDSHEWMEAFADYLWQNCLSDQFFWCWNAVSTGTGSVWEDEYVTLNDKKLKLIASVQPHPAVFSAMEEGGKVCMTPGSDANGYCRRFIYGEAGRTPVGTRNIPDASFAVPLLRVKVTLGGLEDPLPGAAAALEGVRGAIAAWAGAADTTAFFLQYANGLVLQDYVAAADVAEEAVTAARRQRQRRLLSRATIATVTTGSGSTAAAAGSGGSGVLSVVRRWLGAAAAPSQLVLVYEVEDDDDGTLKAAIGAGELTDLQTEIAAVAGLETATVESVKLGADDPVFDDDDLGDDDSSSSGVPRKSSGDSSGGIVGYKLYLIMAACGVFGMLVVYGLLRRCAAKQAAADRARRGGGGMGGMGGGGKGGGKGGMMKKKGNMMEEDVDDTYLTKLDNRNRDRTPYSSAPASPVYRVQAPQQTRRPEEKQTANAKFDPTLLFTAVSHVSVPPTRREVAALQEIPVTPPTNFIVSPVGGW